MSEDRKNMELEFKDEYWLEAKKLLQKEETKIHLLVFQWSIGMRSHSHSCFCA